MIQRTVRVRNTAPRTIRPDDTVQVNPMWFEFDGEHIRFHPYAILVMSIEKTTKQ